MQRNSEIDIMKGAAILLMMVGHTTWLPGWLGSFIYSFHMPLFFLVSGYFAKTYDDYSGSRWDYVLKNAKQLLIPYLIIILLSCVYPLVQAWHFKDIHPVIHRLMANIAALDHVWEGTLFDAPVAPTWFLLALFWGRLLFYELSRCGKWGVPICVLLSISMILLHPYIVTPLCIGRGVEALMFIAIGWAFRKYGLPLWAKICLVLCWAVSWYLGALDMYFYRYSCLPINILGACGGTYLIYLVSKVLCSSRLSLVALFSRFLSWCGRNSLILLAAHTIESSMTIIHVITKSLPFAIPTSLYYGIRHAVAIIGAWMYLNLRYRTERKRLHAEQRATIK